MRFLLRCVAVIVSETLFRADRYRLSRLVGRGLKIGRNVYIMENVMFDYGYPYLIEIGDHCRISREVRILAHDATPFRDLGVTRLAPVRILEGTFIAERAVILPGVTLGPRAMVAAGAVVNRSFPEGAMVAGNPARMYASFDDYLERVRADARDTVRIPKEEIESGRVTPADVARMLESREAVFVHGVPRRDRFYVNADMEEIRSRAGRVFAEAFGAPPERPPSES